jgi:nucleoside-diphosphate-sugar epimerase
MKILLTGSTGFLGSNIYRFLSTNHQVATLSRKNADYNYNIELEIPILDKQFDLVIHCAGKAHSTPTNDFEIASFYKTNIDGIVNILHSLSNSDTLKYFVFISSVSVYGLIEGESINETNPLLAKDPYGKSKIEAEQIVKNWCNEHNIISTILRLPLVVGDSPPGNLGSMIKGIKNGYYFNIAGGGAKKSMVLANDITHFILNAAEKGGIYNLTDGHHPSFNILSKHIAIQMGKTFVPNLPKFIAIILAKIGDLLDNNFPINSEKLSKITSTLTFDDSKARATFGWDPTPVVQGFKLENKLK